MDIYWTPVRCTQKRVVVHYDLCIQMLYLYNTRKPPTRIIRGGGRSQSQLGCVFLFAPNFIATCILLLRFLLSDSWEHHNIIIHDFIGHECDFSHWRGLLNLYARWVYFASLEQTNLPSPRRRVINQRLWDYHRADDLSPLNQFKRARGEGD